jgi:gluconate 2-dehydrogenase gamma chain
VTRDVRRCPFCERKGVHTLERDVPNQPEAGAEPADGIQEMSRRSLLLAGITGVAATTAIGGLVSAPADAASVRAAAMAANPRIRFFTNAEFALVTELAEVIWPTDDLGPGAREAGVAFYIDGQLAGGWGSGDRWYMQGPFLQPADSGHGWQSPMVPRDVYRAALPAVDNYARATYGDWFAVLPARTKNQVMLDLSGGKVTLPLGGQTTFAGADFFTMFRQNVLEGMLADPMYGGNRNLVGWRWVGFPGDPMRRGDPYAKWVFSDKPYPYEHRPLPMTMSKKTGSM